LPQAFRWSGSAGRRTGSAVALDDGAVLVGDDAIEPRVSVWK
jgi:hypothetical protein